MSKLPTYKHKDHTIQFDPDRGQFVATIGGKVSTSSSLGAMKKKIDAALSINFKSFKAFTPKEDKNSWAPQGESPLAAVVVTGIEKFADRWHTRFCFKIEGYDSMPDHVYADTVEAVKAYEALRQHNKEIARVREELDKKRRLLTEALAKHEVKANNFTGKD